MLLIGLNSILYAKPDIKPLGANIAQLGSQYYDFKIKTFTSQDQQRTYQVWLGIPKINNHPKAAFISLFMLDGNAVMSHLNDQLLQQLAQNNAPVLVAIGYKTDLPFESHSRALDYTPADLTTAKPAPDPRNTERMSGGSHDFRMVIINQIAPWVEQNVKLDPTHRAIWGHSYGGLFVLDSLLAGEYFSHYFAASPSLSWANQRIIEKINTVAVDMPKQKHLLLMEGDLSSDQTENKSINFDQQGIESNRKILALIDQQGVDAKFLIYPNLKHGQVFKAALMDVLLNQLYQ
ncbi:MULTISPECIES: alpha/beta hydrolase [unclassified Acinetobacter]|uniref:alpha/beta hydrolase n=1 Tax=unclassified Acinetobacter TaxID=196816 RepID=UPI00293493E1|nr:MULTISPECIES: alpha/beta hydrolase-fold protein [unclassified Acinetobacter]WOE31797.1 alpha/beta hydrolase-fold protein [Acinetobacter sp. SAAs470]WOE37264.1 alpha/beta hydrolase-fold protein [Acinetobacter sp. SAAs474]